MSGAPPNLPPRGTALRLLLGSRRRTPPPERESITNALDWLLAAHEAAGGRGFAVEFSARRGWGPPYPETSGYIVPTLLAARALGHRTPDLDAAVERTGSWLLAIQASDGSYDAPSTRRPMVFDTGQVLFGLLALAGPGGSDRFLEAALRAGDWLVAQQEPDGSWVRHAYREIPHTYYARVSWALLLLFGRTQDERFREAARRQIVWVRKRQEPDGWFSGCSFYPDERPVLHVIAYTIRGVWESSLLLGDRELEAAALRAAEALLRLEGGRGRLEAHFVRGWRPDSRFLCVTGLCQTAGIWLRMGERYGRSDLREAAGRLLRTVRGRQIVDPRHPALHGGLPGSLPVWGSYFPWRLPNWGAKFFIDALLVKTGTMGENAPRG